MNHWKLIEAKFVPKYENVSIIFIDKENNTKLISGVITEESEKYVTLTQYSTSLNGKIYGRGEYLHLGNRLKRFNINEKVYFIHAPFPYKWKVIL